MRIGIGKKQESGAIAFDVDIPGLAPFPVWLERNETPGERGPAWIATYRGERCGALWKRVPKQGGEAFLSGVLESPAFSGGRLEVAVFVAKNGPGHMDMVWRPEQDRRASPEPAAESGEF